MWVLDTSVALKWFFDEEYSQEAMIYLENPSQLFAPNYMLIEFDNVVAKNVRIGDLDPGPARLMRDAIRQLPIQYRDVFKLVNSAFEIALQTRRALYDCFFLALAEELDERLLTADRRFYDGIPAGHFKQRLAWIGYSTR